MAWIRSSDGTLLNAAFLAVVGVRGAGDNTWIVVTDARGLRHDLAGPMPEQDADALLNHLADSLPLHGGLSGLVDLRAAASSLSDEVAARKFSHARAASRGAR